LTVTVTVFDPVVAYVCDLGPSVQALVQTALDAFPVTVKASFVDPSPQLTVTDH
jgi:hypothetical protein